MPIYKKNDMAKVLKAIQQKPPQICLIFGDRFLCRKAAGKIIAALVPDAAARGDAVYAIDGDREEPLKTLAQLKSYNLFGGRRIYQVNGSKLFHSRAVAKGIWDKAQKAWQKKDIEAAGRYIAQLAAVGHAAAGELAALPDGNWRQSFGFPKPQGSLAWIDEAAALCPQDAGEGKKEGSPNAVTAQYEAALTAGIPDGNILILLAETVDKRKKFYKFIYKHGLILDLAVDPGASKGARTDQDTVLQGLIRQTLAEFGKDMEPAAMRALIERVGFHPVAIVRETEKLALYADSAARISMRDLQEVVGRTREDAIFEFTEACTDFDLERALLLATRLLEAGVYPLALVAALRNHFRKLLLVRSFIDSSRPVFVPGMTFAVFQKGYLPELKETRPEQLAELPGHPYALYMMFARARKLAVAGLLVWLRELLALELSLKSSGQSPALLFDRFLIGALAKK
jgi:DNA polymerase-3 subunit delta